MTKGERFRVFLTRLDAAPVASTAAEAFALVASTLNAVEDELSGVPRDPSQWMTDGRMYPPQPDSARRVEGRPEVTRYRTRGHNVFVRVNGALEIRNVSDDAVVARKPGADGRGVEE